MSSAIDRTTPPAAAGGDQVELAIGGMTCASCAARIEKKLNRLEGVTATVNYATEKAKVTFTGDVTPADLIATVEKTGYTAHLPEPPKAETDGGQPVAAEGDDHVRSLRRRLLISTVLTVPVVVMAMVPALQFTYWQWLSLTLAAPVVVWGAWPFHKAAWTNLRHGASTWTRSSRWAPSRHSPGRCTPCSSAPPANRA
jgi:Cu+-exporting ATPase